MRKVLGLVLLLPVMLVAFSMPASADLVSEDSWPTLCGTNDKQAIKLFGSRDFEGDKEVECGSYWANNDPEGNVQDFNFGTTEGAGQIEGMNDETTSMLIFNRSNFGICIAFFPHTEYNAGLGKLTFYVPGHKILVAEDFANPWSSVNNILSSVKMYTDPNNYTQAQCNSFNNQTRPYFFYLDL